MSSVFLLVAVSLFARARAVRHARPRRAWRLGVMAAGYLLLGAAQRPDVPDLARLVVVAIGIALLAYGALARSETRQ